MSGVYIFSIFSVFPTVVLIPYSALTIQLYIQRVTTHSESLYSFTHKQCILVQYLLRLRGYIFQECRFPTRGWVGWRGPGPTRRSYSSAPTTPWWTTNISSTGGVEHIYTVMIRYLYFSLFIY